MMKFKDMPYERIDFVQVKEQLKGLMTELSEAKSGEEQFEIHRKFYKLNDRVQTQVTLCSIRHTIDTTMDFMKKNRIIMMSRCRNIPICVWNTRSCCLHLPTERYWKKKSDQWLLKTWKLP